MENLELRSPARKVGGIVYFGRMLDKIRVHAKGLLPGDYQPNLGKGFDRSCVTFLQLDYPQLVERVRAGGTDKEILDWALQTGRRPSDEEIQVWNDYMRKRGWEDEVSEMVTRRKKEAGMTERADIRTMFEFIDADEGRSLLGAMS